MNDITSKAITKVTTALIRAGVPSKNIDTKTSRSGFSGYITATHGGRTVTIRCSNHANKAIKFNTMTGEMEEVETPEFDTYELGATNAAKAAIAALGLTYVPATVRGFGLVGRFKAAEKANYARGIPRIIIDGRVLFFSDINPVHAKDAATAKANVEALERQAINGVSEADRKIIDASVESDRIAYLNRYR
jgi:hypothetical protein